MKSPMIKKLNKMYDKRLAIKDLIFNLLLIVCSTIFWYIIIDFLFELNNDISFVNYMLNRL